MDILSTVLRRVLSGVSRYSDVGDGGGGANCSCMSRQSRVMLPPARCSTYRSRDSSEESSTLDERRRSDVDKMSIREYMSGNLRQNLSQGVCVQTA